MASDKTILLSDSKRAEKNTIENVFWKRLIYWFTKKQAVENMQKFMPFSHETDNIAHNYFKNCIQKLRSNQYFVTLTQNVAYKFYSRNSNIIKQWSIISCPISVTLDCDESIWLNLQISSTEKVLETW